MTAKVILYEDLSDNLKKHQKLQKLLKIDKDPNCFLINIHDEDLNTIRYKNALIYVMGSKELVDHINWENYRVVGYGPAFNQLKNPKNRDKLVKDLQKGIETNIFDENDINLVDPKELLTQKSAIKLNPIPRTPDIPKLEGSIDDAISCIQYLEQSNIPIALPELNTFISEDTTKNSLSYKELIALLLVFKRLGAEKLYWKDKVVFNKEDSVD